MRNKPEFICPAASVSAEHRTEKPRLAHVNVRLKDDRPDGDWAIEWRQVRACSLSHAIELAQAMPDVGWCYEASWIPGGVAT